VVDSHGGSLRLADRDGGGLIVEMALPLRRRKPAAPAAAAALAVAGLFVAALLAAPGQGEAAENRYPAPQPPPEGERTLTIVGTTDTPLFARFVEGFQQVRPDVSVIYRETDTLVMYEEFLGGSIEPKPDLMISSAADLQLKLANDGHALAHPSQYLQTVPRWAQWRGEVIGFTFEPAVIIYNPDL